MDRFIYIRNAEDDAYVNKAENFKGMEQSTSAQVILYFESPISSSTTMTGAYDKITLVVTADKEKRSYDGYWWRFSWWKIRLNSRYCR